MLGLLTRTLEYPLGEDGQQLAGSKSIITTYNYEFNNQKIVGALIKETDSLGQSIVYYYDNTDGKLLATVNSSANTGLCYTYDVMGRLTNVTPATYVSNTSYTPVTNAESVEYTYTGNGLLSSIITESTTYDFAYNAFGNQTSVGIGDDTLASYEYNPKNGKLKKITYGNGFVVEYVYNTLELLTEVWYTENNVRYKAHEYVYTANGQLYEYKDNVSGKTVIYKYDFDKRLSSISEYDNDNVYYGFQNSVEYNEEGNLSKTLYSINHYNGTNVNNTFWSYNYRYTGDGKLSHVDISTAQNNVTEEYTYDSYGRVSEQHKTVSDATGTEMVDSSTIYTYKDNGDYTSALVHTYQHALSGAGLVYTYSYDANGNITKISYSNGKEIRYYYDDLGQLIREDNPFISSTYVYAYDNAGNIVAAIKYGYTAEGVTPTGGTVREYGYSTGEWGDQLTSYRGQTITYDAIGNPLTYYNGQNYLFTWEGRRLVSASTGYNFNSTYTYTYNDDGLRTSKTINGVTTNYIYSGTQLIAEERAGNITIYLYDASGSPIGMQYHSIYHAEDEWDVYWYEKNLQGDVVAVYDSDGTIHIEYNYTAWGYCTYTDYENSSAINNPFRYRGYYFDEGLNLYYLGSRYYDQNTGRFISADSYVSTGTGLLGYNMYAYCNNNPVMMVDHSGTIPFYDHYYTPAIEAFAKWLFDRFYEWYEKDKKSLEFDDDIDYKVSENGGESTINNSYKVTNPVAMNEYIEANRGAEVNGTTTGVVYEWIVHSAAYRVGKVIAPVAPSLSYELIQRGNDVTFGSTIYDDWHSGGAIVMWIGYFSTAPISATVDAVIEIFEVD